MNMPYVQACPTWTEPFLWFFRGRRATEISPLVVGLNVSILLHEIQHCEERTLINVMNSHPRWAIKNTLNITTKSVRKKSCFNNASRWQKRQTSMFIVVIWWQGVIMRETQVHNSTSKRKTTCFHMFTGDYRMDWFTSTDGSTVHIIACNVGTRPAYSWRTILVFFPNHAWIKICKSVRIHVPTLIIWKLMLSFVFPLR